MDIRTLGDFICLAEHRHFGATAHERNISVSGLSRRIKSLEQWVGAELIDRNATPLELTTAGDELVTLATEIMNHMKLAETSGNLKFASLLFPTGSDDQQTVPRKLGVAQAKCSISETLPTFAIKPFHCLSSDPYSRTICIALSHALRDQIGQAPLTELVVGDHPADFLVDGTLVLKGDSAHLTLQVAKSNSGKLILSRKYVHASADIELGLEEMAADFGWTVMQRVRLLIAQEGVRLSPDDRSNLQNFMIAHEFASNPLRSHQVLPALNALRRKERAPHWFHHAAGISELIAWGSKPMDWARLARARSHAETILTTEPSFYPGEMLLALTAAFQRDFPEAERAMHRALAAAPNDTTQTIGAGIVELSLGQHETALEKLQKSRKYEPGQLWYSPIYAAQALYQMGRYEEAAREIDLRRSPFPDAVGLRLASLAQSGELDQAPILRVAMEFFAPAGFKKMYLHRFPFADKAHTEHLVDGLKKAGIAPVLPE